MRRFVLAICAVVTLLAAVSCASAPPPPPPSLEKTTLAAPRGPVTDLAAVLSDDDERDLQRRLDAIRDEQLGEIFVYIMPALVAGEPMEQLTLRSANSWPIGKRAIIIFAFMQDRKVRVEVARDLEPIVTDDLAMRVIEEQIAPHFTKGDYAAGLGDAVDRLVTILRKAR